MSTRTVIQPDEGQDVANADRDTDPFDEASVMGVDHRERHLGRQ